MRQQPETCPIGLRLSGSQRGGPHGARGVTAPHRHPRLDNRDAAALIRRTVTLARCGTFLLGPTVRHGAQGDPATGRSFPHATQCGRASSFRQSRRERATAAGTSPSAAPVGPCLRAAGAGTIFCAMGRVDAGIMRGRPLERERHRRVVAGATPASRFFFALVAQAERLARRGQGDAGASPARGTTFFPLGVSPGSREPGGRKPGRTLKLVDQPPACCVRDRGAPSRSPLPGAIGGFLHPARLVCSDETPSPFFPCETRPLAHDAVAAGGARGAILGAS